MPRRRPRNRSRLRGAAATPALHLGDELAVAFMGVLVTLVRADSAINREESDALRAIASEICGGEFDFESVLLERRTLPDLVRLVGRGSDPYRGVSQPGAREIGSALVARLGRRPALAS